ncbi:MAG: phage portal protein, partial [Anaerolineales bacterium]|nr:phage portal protein [Anaerolineales bacterium]
VRVDADTALTIATVYRCVRLLAGTFAMLPLNILIDMLNGTKKRADDLPLDYLLSAEPNRYQDSFQWREMLFGHLLLRGNLYCRIVPGMNGPVSELIPMHPDSVTPERLPDGTVRYKIRLQTGQTETLNQDDVFHVRGLSSDGLTGLSVIGLMRETLGLALATESYGARFFSQNATPGGVLTIPGTLDEEAQARLSKSWQEAHSGLANSHKVAILEQGLDWKQVGMTSEDAQFLQTRSFQRNEITTAFGIPPHMVGDTEKSTSWGTGIEQQTIGFVVWTLLPWLVRVEQAINRQLIIGPQPYYAKFNVKGLLRGDSAARYSAYAIARQWGLQNANEIRALEDMDPIDGPAGEEYLNPLNFAPAGTTAPRPAPPPPSNGQAQLLAHDYVMDRVAREIGCIKKAAVRFAADEPAWGVWLTEFYGRHAEELAATLHIDPDAAARYAEEHRQQIAEHGVGIMEQMESEWALRLATLALGGE